MGERYKVESSEGMVSVEDTKFSEKDDFVGLEVFFLGGDHLSVRLAGIDRSALKIFSKEAMLRFVSALKSKLEEDGRQL